MTAVLLCLFALGEVFKSESLSAYRDAVAILLTGSAAVMTLSAAQLARLNREREKMARESARHITQAARNAGLGLWAWTPAADRFWGSSTFLEILGLPEREGNWMTSPRISSRRPGQVLRPDKGGGARRGREEYECRVPRENGTAG